MLRVYNVIKFILVYKCCNFLSRLRQYVTVTYLHLIFKAYLADIQNYSFIIFLCKQSQKSPSFLRYKQIRTTRYKIKGFMQYMYLYWNSELMDRDGFGWICKKIVLLVLTTYTQHLTLQVLWLLYHQNNILKYKNLYLPNKMFQPYVVCIMCNVLYMYNSNKRFHEKYEKG